MIQYNRNSVNTFRIGNKEIQSFISRQDHNVDWKTVESFGEEWGKFHEFDDAEINRMGDQYFDIVDETVLNKNTSVLDVGCGSGRWSRYIAKRAGTIDAIDPSDAVFQALKLTQEFLNVRVSQASVDSIPFNDNSFDLVFSIGVLHHIPDTNDGIKKCVAKVKSGGYFLTYLYYDFENRGILFKTTYYLSNIIRLLVNKFPSGLKKFCCEVLAVLLYMPFVLLCRLLDTNKITRPLVKYIPLSYYRDKSFMVIRNDSLDRFGTPLEKRFSRKDIVKMMTEAGLTDIHFSPNEPYWHAIGRKK